MAKRIEFEDEAAHKAKRFLSEHVSREGFEYLIKKAKPKSPAKFNDFDERRFQLNCENSKDDKKEVFTVQKRS